MKIFTNVFLIVLASAGVSQAETRALNLSASPVCEVLRKYPKAPGEKLSFEAGEVSAICKPFVKFTRPELDRCGDTSKDPYTSTASSRSNFTWASRNEMFKKGKINMFADPEWQSRVPAVAKHVDELKESASRLCCGGDESCRAEFEKVQVSFCKPGDDPNAPDPCVFGGSYKMPAEGYDSIFRAIFKTHGADGELRHIAERNLTLQDSRDALAAVGPASGSISLSSYVSKTAGAAPLEPVILHEFGHACSMIRMQQAALAGSPQKSAAALKAQRAVQWLDSARRRCDRQLELPEAYFDFWESLGESRALAHCLQGLTIANQKNQIDRPCPGLCAGHYLEESVGIAFSLLAGDARGLDSSVFPNTCDHVRDGQHPMVSDVAECLAQNSPRFRNKLREAYGCAVVTADISVKERPSAKHSAARRLSDSRELR